MVFALGSPVIELNPPPPASFLVVWRRQKLGRGWDAGDVKHRGSLWVSLFENRWRCFSAWLDLLSTSAILFPKRKVNPVEALLQRPGWYMVGTRSLALGKGNCRGYVYRHSPEQAMARYQPRPWRGHRIEGTVLQARTEGGGWPNPQLRPTPPIAIFAGPGCGLDWTFARTCSFVRRLVDPPVTFFCSFSWG